MVVAGIAQVVEFRAGGRRVVADDKRGQQAGAGRIGVLESAVAVEIVELAVHAVDLEDEAGGREHVRGQVGRVGIAHDHCGEGIVLHFAEQMQAVEPLEVVEPVAVLQLFHLHFEDEVEGRAQHAAEGHDLFGEAADPKINVLEPAERPAGVDSGRIEKRQSIRVECSQRVRVCRKHEAPECRPRDECQGSVTLFLQSDGARY